MPAYFGYLRVSTDGQDVQSQELGLIKYANQLGFAPIEIVSETASRDKNWRSRKLGEILNKCKEGDLIITPEFTRLGASPGQVFSFLEEAAAKKVIVHITKTQTVMDGSMLSQILANTFAMAAMIELDFIRMRTKEGMELAKARGKEIGRPRGPSDYSKLNGREHEVSQLLSTGLSKRKAAKYLQVSYSCLDRFVKRQMFRQVNSLDNKAPKN